MTTAEILRGAKEKIEKHGWIQNSYGSDEIGFCSSGAIQSFVGLPRNQCARLCHPAMIAVRNAVGEYCIPEWNDRPGRTKEEVLAAFDKAIALAEAA